MTANINSLNTTSGMTLAVLPKANENGKSFFQRLAGLFGTRLLVNPRVDPYSFSNPQNQKTYLTFHRTMW